MRTMGERVGRAFGVLVVSAVAACSSEEAGGAASPAATDGGACQKRTCASSSCGKVDDGCGGTIDCGPCANADGCSGPGCAPQVPMGWTAVDAGDLLSAGMYDLWGTGGRYWAVGDQGLLWAFDAGTWTQSVQSNYQLLSIYGLAADDFWFGGVAEFVAHQTATGVNIIQASNALDITAVWPEPGGAVWTATGGTAGPVRHWDGQTWTETQRPTDGEIGSFWGSSTTDIWAVEITGAMIHWSGASWTQESIPSRVGLASVWGTSKSDVWAVGAGVILHYDGATWNLEDPSIGATLYDVWGPGDGTVWVVGDAGAIWHGRAGATFERSTSGTDFTLNAIWGSSASDIWAVGAGGVKIHYGPVSGSGLDAGPACSEYGYGCMNHPCCPGYRCTPFSARVSVCQ